MEDGEDLEQALARELGEDVGVTPVYWYILCSILDASGDARGGATYHLFTVRTWTGGPLATTNDERTARAWFTVDEACALDDLAVEDDRNVFRRISF